LTTGDSLSKTLARSVAKISKGGGLPVEAEDEDDLLDEFKSRNVAKVEAL